MGRISRRRDAEAHIDSLIPELDWLAAAEAVDQSWPGPGPKLRNLRPWIDILAGDRHVTLVMATCAAARAALRHWDEWVARDEQIAMQSILDGDTPANQLAAVECWLANPSGRSRNLASDTVDYTKQLHWFHAEYEEVWFNQPGMWAIESSEFCVLTLTGDPYSRDTIETNAFLSVLCAINSFRAADGDDLREAIGKIRVAIQLQLEQ